MQLKRTSHAIYDTKYHLVRTPKYRKWILREGVRERLKAIFEEISMNHDLMNHDFGIDTMEIAQDHVHIFLCFPPRYSISKVVVMLKSISAGVIFEKHPEVKRELCGGEFWEDGYFARTVGDKVTAEVIRNYIKYHHKQEKSPEQPELF